MRNCIALCNVRTQDCRVPLSYYLHWYFWLSWNLLKERALRYQSSWHYHRILNQMSIWTFIHLNIVSSLHWVPLRSIALLPTINQQCVIKIFMAGQDGHIHTDGYRTAVLQWNEFIAMDQLVRINAMIQEQWGSSINIWPLKPPFMQTSSNVQ